ncbi:hypothetical protein [Arthrobacter sp. CG_A4]|uniref:hypothetical protein n=1 Tax=Arthrobacter sp. CG_A4 TaxID=3071706 RepID=UPI002E0B7438|nr:hypothetical protein [Arthrobacter sp. CG_A4]
MAAHPMGRATGVLTGLAIGFASAALVLAPWLATGAKLPLQNLWQAGVLPEDMPLALLPVNQYHALRVAVLLFVGGAVAALGVRFFRRVVDAQAWSAAVGVLLVHSIAIIQTFAVVADGLGIHGPRVDQRAVLYFGGLLGGAVFAALLAQAVFWLVSRSSVSPVSLGLALSAVPFSSWIVDAVSMLSPPTGLPIEISLISTWLPAVIVGVVLGRCGIRPLRRLIVWVASLAALWITPALFTSVRSALEMRVLDGDLQAMSEVVTQIFSLALGIFAVPVLFALALGGILTGVHMTIRRRAHGSG